MSLSSKIVVYPIVIITLLLSPMINAQTSGPAMQDTNQEPETKAAFAAYNKKNYKEAFTLFHNAAEQGNTTAMTTPDYSEALYHYNKAADRGNSEAVYAIGQLYEKGHGVTKSEKEAYSHYIKAADAGDLRAMHKIAKAYTKGIHFQKDLKKRLNGAYS